MAVKVFETNDVLPATTQLRISWLGTSYEGSPYWLNLGTGNLTFASSSYTHFISHTGEPYTGDSMWYIGGSYVASASGENLVDTIENNYVDIDTSTWTLEQRTVTYYVTMGEDIYWEDLNVEPSSPSIADKLQELIDIKQDIKEAIENKDVDLTGVDFGGYAEKIDTLPAVVELTQAQYDALPVYDDNTYYLIVEE